MSISGPATADRIPKKQGEILGWLFNRATLCQCTNSEQHKNVFTFEGADVLLVYRNI